MAAGKSSDSSIATNRRARHDYKILDTLEAGLELKGTEVKSIRAGRANISDAFARIENGQAYLYQCDISPYERASFYNHEPRRARRLLLHKQEIVKLFNNVTVKGRSLIALDLHWKGGRVKVQLGIAEGKTHGDRRESLKSADAKREIDRAMKNRR